MSTGTGGPGGTLSPDEAFSVLGNGSRMQILQTLGEAEQPLAFSELRERVGMSDSGQFNYHIGELEDHFVQKTDDGYALRQAGRRVIMAVLSGAVTSAPVLERTRIDKSCWYCGAPIEMSYSEERVEMYCTECSGTFGESFQTERRTVDSPAPGYLGKVTLPPAGLQHRTSEEVCQAAWIWHHLQMLAVGSQLCPHCSASIDRTVDVCRTHDASDGLCEACDRQHAIHLVARCTNCIFEVEGPYMLCLIANTDLLAFLLSHDRNPVSWISIATAGRTHIHNAGDGFRERLLSEEPFEAQFTFAIDDDAITLTVGDDLTVVDVTTHDTAEAV